MNAAPAVLSLEDAVFPRLLADARPTSVRAWVPNCASGQVAHALAARLLTYLDLQGIDCEVRVFGSERDANLMGIARTGHYSRESYESSPPELQRFLEPTLKGFQVKKRVRECLLFSIHDLNKDPPFSRLDLVVTDRMFHDVKAAEGAALLQRLHYSLFPHGMLVLLDGVIPEDVDSWFVRLDDDAPVFAARPDRAPHLASARRVVESWPRDTSDEQLVRELAQNLMLDRYAPACLIVNERRKIVSSLGNASKYLHTPSGPRTRDLLSVIAPELHDVVRALCEAPYSQNGRSSEIEVTLDGGRLALRIVTHPLSVAGTNLRAFVFMENRPVAASTGASEASERLSVERMRRDLQVLKTEFQASSEELRGSMEELRMLNEELESANHELATARNQAQFINEALTSSNEELKATIGELEGVNAELRSLIVAPKLAAILLDRNLRIRGFTPAACDFVPLLPSDRGRFLTDFASEFEHEDLKGAATQVMATAEHAEIELSVAAKWFALRVLPLRDAKNRIDGVTLAFTDITRQKSAELEVERLRTRLSTQQRWVERIASGGNSSRSSG